MKSLFSPARFVFPSCVVLGLASAAVGCSGGVTSEPAASVDSVATRAPVATAAHGQVRFLGSALGDVPLTAPQRAEVEKLASDAEARHGDVRAARQAFTLALALQVEAGAIDRTALSPRIDALVAAVQRSQPADRAAFERLHALLGPDQRTAFVNALDARRHDRMEQGREKHPLQRWAKDLGLTDDQRAQLKAIFKSRWAGNRQDSGAERPHGGQGRGAKLMEAFRQDRFVMDEVAPAGDVSAEVRTKSAQMLEIVEQALPILTPSQRTIAAQKLRDRSASLDEGGPGLAP